jgi:hypothetical protein
MELQSYSFKETSRWAVENNPEARDSVLLKIGHQTSSGPYDYPPDGVYCRLAKNDSQAYNCAQIVQDSWDCAKAHSWLKICTNYHDSACNGDLVRVPGMNLIDCEKLIIVKAMQEMRWLALSYVWGSSAQTDDPAEYREGSHLPTKLPATIKDAISVTLQLGNRYLWVDEYCIDQSNDEHRFDQIKRMDQIYHGADLTIVAAAGEDKFHGLPGVGTTKRMDRAVVRVKDVIVFSNGPEPDSEAKMSKWFTRAW